MAWRIGWIAGWAVAVGVLGAAGSPAHADGKMLLARCEQAERLLDDQRIDDPVDAGFCLGYVGAVLNTLQVLNNGLDARERVCLPKQGVEVGQAIRLAMRFLRENPQRLAENEAALVLSALRRAYPCR